MEIAAALLDLLHSDHVHSQGSGYWRSVNPTFVATCGIMTINNVETYYETTYNSMKMQHE